MNIPLHSIASVLAEDVEISEVFLVVGFQINIRGLDDLIVLEDKNKKTFFVDPKNVISRKDKTIDDMFLPGVFKKEHNEI